MSRRRDTALITGASSGIGEVLTRIFAANGHDLILVARGAAKLERLADELATEHGVKVSVRPTDLGKTGAAAKLCNALEREGLRVDVLVNSAGVLEHGSFVGMAPADHQRMVQLNVSGLTDMVSHLLPPMVKRGSGRVLNVASIAAFQPLPSLATYAATKAYVLSLSEALSEELRDTGVTVTALCPGVTDTNMMKKAQQQSDGLKLPTMLIGDVESVAQEAFDALMSGTAVVVPGTLNLASTMTTRAMPRWLTRRLMGFMGRSTLKD